MEKEKEVKTAILTDEDGVEYELEVIKEFNYKDKRYAVLYEEGCHCEDECECDDECGDDCECDCHSEEDMCEDSDHIYILEVIKDDDGNDTYNEVDEKLMEELVPIVEKELYPTEE
jgi:uncharacterized protein YrzB (UPF0473 family)